MDYTRIIDEALSGIAAAWWIVAVGLVLSIAWLPAVKGWVGELLVRLSARFLLDRRVYRLFHDLTLATPDGTTQIDHVFISPFGVFVVETKNMKGWIFGSEKQRQWTQKLYRHSRQFQNPLRQNYKHAKTIQERLGLPADAVHSVVVFAGGSTFKTTMPLNVVKGGAYIRYIRRFR